MGAGAALLCPRAEQAEEKRAHRVLFSAFFLAHTALPFVIADFHPMTFAQFMCLMGAGAATLGHSA